MKLIIDKAIPFIDGVFEPYAEVVYKTGSEICREDLSDVDGMVIRTRTRCNAALLDGTPVKIISTATIGTDHIDLDYCAAHGIKVENAAGCNAGGVMDYVFSALYGAAARKSINLSGATLGIIGVGNVGSRVALTGRQLGFNVLLNDPPRAAAEGPDRFCDLDTLLASSDIVTMHVPLNEATRGMADEGFFRKMKPGAIFINAARGEVMVDDALIGAAPKLSAIVIDTWNNEPHVSRELMDLVDIATPHIAGYSYQGKQIGTMMAVRSIAYFFGIDSLCNFFPPAEVAELTAVRLDIEGLNQGQIASVFQYNYPIFTDDFIFRSNPDGFEEIRSNYSYRREFFIE